MQIELRDVITKLANVARQREARIVAAELYLPVDVAIFILFEPKLHTQLDHLERQLTLQTLRQLC